MTRTRSFVLALVSVLLFASVSVEAAVPTIPSGPDGTLFSCSEMEDAFGCYGELTDSIGNPTRLRVAIRQVRRLIRVTRRDARRARRDGDVARFEELLGDVSTYKSIKKNLRPCIVWEDYECGGSEGGGGENESGGNQNVAGACTELAEAGADLRMSQRIVNGAVCQQGTSPIVPVEYYGSQHCSGNYIGDGLVLTAGHCVDGVSCSGLSVKDGSGTTAYGVSCQLHSKYNTNPFEANDVALIFLDRNLNARKIPVVTSQVLSVGSTILIAGYGRNETELTGDNLKDFRAGYNTVNQLTTGGIYSIFDPSDLNQSNSCNGDSGGGALAQVNGVWTLVGTVSWGEDQNCGMTGNTDNSVWARLSNPSIQSFLAAHTSGVVD